MSERERDARGGMSRSVWKSEEEIRPRGGPLPRHSHADVCIVGAGITGLTTAYLLAKAGRSVVVLERDAVGAGETGRTSAHLASALDDRFTHLESLHGTEGARLAARSHAHAIDVIEHVVERENIDCDFVRVDGILHLGPEQDRQSLVDEADAARRAGLAVELLDVPVGPALGAGPCLRFPRQAQLHPMRYLAGLVSAIERMGGRIHLGANVERFEGGARARAVTDDGREVLASSLVVATNVPVNDRMVIHTKQAAYRSYCIALEVPRGSVPRVLSWDTAEPYHYVRIESPRARGDDARDLLIVGGADHRTGDDLQAEGRWDHLESWARDRYPMAGRLVERWSGQILEPIDGLAYLGRNPGDAPNVYVATGDSGHGLTHGTIAATIFLSEISGQVSPYSALYDPRRITLRSLPAFARDAWATAAHYADWVRPGDAATEDEIPPGEGATMRVGGRRLAVHRDALGRLHRLSAVCRHLGGVVHWNPAEKTWDCPCHGARYDRTGCVMNGPALSDLEPVDDVVVTPATLPTTE